MQYSRIVTGGRRASTFLAAVVLACAPASGPDPSSTAFFDAPGLDGVPVRVEAVPARILPANLPAAEMVAALVTPDRVTGIPEEVFEFGAGFGRREEWDADRLLTRYRGESVLALEPDLVLCASYQDLETTAMLRRVGVPVAGLPTVRRFEDVEATLTFLGRLLDAEGRAEELVDSMRTRRAALAERTRAWAGRTGLVYTNYGTGAWTQGAESPAEILLELAGLRNAGGAGGIEGHYQIDVEHLLALDPDVIVCGEAVSDLGASAEVLRGSEVLRGLTALGEDRVVVLSAHHYQTTSHLILDAAEALVAELERIGLGSE